MIRFRPLLGPTLFTVPAVLLMLGLAVWQVQRLQWKTALIAERTERVHAPAVPPPKAGDDLAAAEYRHVALTGQYRNDKEMYLAARSLRGNPGYHVVTPFQLADGTTVMVDRGWIPLQRKDPASRAAGQIAGTATIDGVVRLPVKQAWMVPDNEPARNIWFWVDLPAMARWAGVEGPIAPYFVDAGREANPGGLPIGGQTVIDLPNDHLQYAITWFALAIGLTTVYLVFHHQRGRLVIRRQP